MKRCVVFREEGVTGCGHTDGVREITNKALMLLPLRVVDSAMEMLPSTSLFPEFAMSGLQIAQHRMKYASVHMIVSDE